MIKRWIFYLAALLGCAVFWSANQTWLSRLLFLVMVWLPWFSLAISLPSMLRAQPVISVPDRMDVGQSQQVDVMLRSKLPLPPYLCKLELLHTLTGEKTALKPGQALPAEHCGELQLRCKKFEIYDLLGLFCLRPKNLPLRSILVYPAKVPTDHPAELERSLAHSWQPKPGGGFAENHEMRLFRPGDSLNQVHWKLTAKTGKLTIRQPMIPRHGRILLTLDISGTAEELDTKLGKFLWLGEYLVEKDLHFTVEARTGTGPLSLSVRDPAEFSAATAQLLRCKPLTEDSPAAAHSAASWHYHIGGGQHEA